MVSLIVTAVLAVALALVWLNSRRTVVTLYPGTTGLLYRNGQFVRELPGGRHARFDPLGREWIVKASTSALPVVLAEVTVLSKDQFSFRLGLSPIAAVIDARRLAESQPAIDSYGALPVTLTAAHPALQPLIAAAALDVAGARTLAEILAEPSAVTDAVRARVADAVPGVSISDVLLTAINLPPETRRMFTEVERARLEALGTLERARGEQAALRVLANAARLLADNPALANLRLLQAIEQGKGATTVVLGDAATAAMIGATPASA